MRIERWYWLGAFCVASFMVHLVLVMSSRSFANPVSALRSRTA